jgi:hypothetical protein
MRTLFHRSNFYNVVHQLYGQLGTFGTGFTFELADPRAGIRFHPLVVGEYVLDVDENGRVDTIFRSSPMTTRQLVRRFGYDKLPETVRRIHDNPGRGSVDRFNVIHGVYPRDDRNPGKLDSKNMPWASVYYLEAGEGSKNIAGGLQYPHLLSESGFAEFPGFGPRWDVTGGDVYGDSPGMDVLGNVLQMQAMERSKLKALQKLVDPPMARPSGTKGLSLLPGADNVYEMNSGSNQPIYPIMNVRPDTQGVMMALEDLKTEIRQGLYNDLFKMLMDSDRRQITAREIAAKEEEKLILLGPVLERLHDEMFMPMIDRTWNLMMEQNMLPEPPEEVQGQDLKIEFISLLAQAQKMVSTTAVDQFMNFVSIHGQLFPELLDVVNTDKMADGYASFLGVETDMLHSQDDRDSKREQRAQQIQQAQQAEQMAAMQAGANTAQTLANTPTQQEQPNALDALLGSFGGGA